MECERESSTGDDCCFTVLSLSQLYFFQRLKLTEGNRSPNNPETTSIKRIIALEGDTVYTRAPYPYPTATIPRNHVWVEGDNRDGMKTLDSHHYGPVTKALVLGTVTHVVWPWKSAGAVEWWKWKGKTRVLEGRTERAPGFD